MPTTTTSTTDHPSTRATTRSRATAPAHTHHLPPGAFTRRVMNPLVAFAVRRGVRVWGACLLETTGRRSGARHRTPVNVLNLDGIDHLVAPRGTTEWVRNVRAASGACVVVSGRKAQPLVATELADHEKPAVLRAYLQRWRWEVGAFFDGIGPEASDAEILGVASRYPVFRLSAR